jgi:hypothetical protein
MIARILRREIALSELQPQEPALADTDDPSDQRGSK